MKAGQRIAAVTATLAVAWGGVAIAAPVASAQPLECTAEHLTGDAGHHGAAVRCHGAPFFGVIECRIRDSGYRYSVFGNRAEDGEISTAWCGLGADVTAVNSISD